MQLQLLRHGEPAGGARYWGAIDVALSEVGWQQMRSAVQGRRWQRIVSSPLRRCAAFAASLAHELGASCHYDADVREMSFGAWEGRSAAELMQSDPQGLRRFWSDPFTHTPPGGESLAALQTRIAQALARIVAQAHGAQTLIVTHSGPIRLALAAQSGTPLSRLLDIEVPYAALITIACRGDGSVLAAAPPPGSEQR